MNNNDIVLWLFIIFFILWLLQIIHRINIKIKIQKLANNTLEITPEEFFKIRTTKNGNKYISIDKEFSGVYILYNKTKNMYYVGQAKKIFQRVNQHFTGHGNGDVYADYKYGDDFTIKMIELENSGFNTLNELERHTIKEYNAFSKGYNKTRGNKN